MSERPGAPAVLRDVAGKSSRSQTQTVLRVLDRYADALYRVARGITRDARATGRVLEDVVARLASAAPSLDDETLARWLYRITTHAALARCAESSGDRGAPLDLHLPAFLPDGHRAGDADFVRRDWSGLSDDALRASGASPVVDRTIAEMPPRHRAALVLRDAERLAVETVGEVLGEPVSSVQARLHEARMALRETLTRTLAAPDPSRPRSGTLRAVGLGRP